MSNVAEKGRRNYSPDPDPDADEVELELGEGVA